MKLLKLGLLLAWVLILLTGCMKEYEESDVVDNPHSGKVTLSVRSAIVDGNTIYGQLNGTIFFQAQSALAISSYTWTINGTNQKTGNPVDYKFTSVGDFALMLVAVDAANASHTVKATIRIVQDIDAYEPIRFSTPILVTGTDRYRYEIFAKKRLSGNHPYFFEGDPTNWAKVYLAKQDTNYHFRSGQFVAATEAEYGEWVRVTFEAAANGNYSLGIGKHNQTTNDYPWGNYTGSAYVDPANGSKIRFRAINGQVWPIAAIPVPGDAGDEFISLKVETDSIRIFVNNGRAFNRLEFVQFMNADGTTLGGAVSQRAIANFPNWGMVSLHKSSANFDSNSYVRFKAGLDRNAPTTYLDLSQSRFYNSAKGWIEFAVVPVMVP